VIASGSASRSKLVVVSGVSEGEALALLAPAGPHGTKA
jgi:hypothetical protein